MAAPLLTPDNRLLTWSIGDMGLYGAAITPATLAAVEDRAAANDSAGATPADNPEIMAGENPASSPAADAAAPSGIGLAPDVSDGSGGSFQPATALATLAPVPALQAPIVPAAAADVSGGSGGVFVPAPIPAPTTITVPTAQPDAAAGDMLAAPTLPQSVPVTDSVLSVPIVTVADTALAATAAIPPVTDAVGSTVTGITQAAADTLGATVTAATATVAEVGDVAAGATETVTSVADTAVDAVASTATAAVASVTPAVASVVEALAETDVVAPVTSAANDLLTGVGGTDPAGGVATLVDMVSAADEFDLSQVATAPVAEVGSIVDMLAADLTDAPLLGDVHDDADSGDDGGPIGLFGL